MDAANRTNSNEVNRMAEDESVLASPPTQDVAVHVRDYERFTKLMFRGAIVCLIIGLLSLIFIKAYW